MILIACLGKPAELFALPPDYWGVAESTTIPAIRGYHAPSIIINNTEKTPKRHASFLQRFTQVIGR
jgi:hypothetical protein